MNGAFGEVFACPTQRKGRLCRFETLNLVSDVHNGGVGALRQDEPFHCPDIEIVVAPVGCESYYRHNNANVVKQ